MGSKSYPLLRKSFYNKLCKIPWNRSSLQENLQAERNRIHLNLRLDVQKYFSLSRISSIVLVLTWMNIHNVLTWSERPFVLWISPYTERMSSRF